MKSVPGHLKVGAVPFYNPRYSADVTAPFANLEHKVNTRLKKKLLTDAASFGELGILSLLITLISSNWHQIITILNINTVRGLSVKPVIRQAESKVHQNVHCQNPRFRPSKKN